MQKDSLYIQDSQLVVVKDEDSNRLLAYDSIDGITLSSEGILLEVNDELANKITQGFEIDICEYGIDVINEGDVIC